MKIRSKNIRLTTVLTLQKDSDNFENCLFLKKRIMKNIFLSTLILPLSIFAQQPEKAIFKKEPVSYYQHTIVKSLKGDFDNKEHTKLKVDDRGINYPTDPSLYKTVWCSNSISQGNTGTCWSFSTSSFMESEVKRIANKEVNLSEMYTVYWEYVERMKYFIQYKGEMHLGEGSETNAIPKIMAKYGAVPYSAYKGKKSENQFYNHEDLFEKVEALFNTIKQEENWDEEKAVASLKLLLNRNIGEPPIAITIDGKKMTPKEYLASLKIEPLNYVTFMSLMEAPYYKKTVYNVPDNWWRSDDYINIPLEDFTSIIKESLKKGYSISIGSDVSEPGFDKISQTAIIPKFDIASEHINESSRQLRFANGSTTDDHAMHLVGYYQKENGENWFLIKDSGSGSRNGKLDDKKFGYYFMNEDYIKLKMMTITVHKDAAEKYLSKIKK